jgi:multidrug efflux pump subunit AcrA (membrane-fusion protein)
MRTMSWTTVVICLGLAGCGSKEDTNVPAVSAASQAAIHAAVVEANVSEVPIRVEVTGQVATVYQATLSSRIQGTIDRVMVLEGTEVKKGQTLIELDQRDLQADLARAVAEVENAQAHLSRNAAQDGRPEPIAPRGHGRRERCEGCWLRQSNPCDD